MLEKYDEHMVYLDEEGESLTVECVSGDYALLFSVNDNDQVGVSSSDVAKVVQTLVELADLNVAKDFVVTKKETVEEAYVATPTRAPLTDGHMLTNEDIAKLVAPGDVFQSRDTPSVFARVVKVIGGTVIYVSSYNLFKEDHREESEIYLPFASFVVSFAMWRPAPPVTTTGTSGPLIPERLAAAGYAKEKVEVTWFKPDVAPVGAPDIKLGDKLWLKNAAHEIIGNDLFTVGDRTYRRLSFRNDSYPVIYRTNDAMLEKLK